MAFSSALVLKGLGGLATAGVGGAGIWLAYDWIDNRGMTTIDKKFYKLADEVEKIKSSSDANGDRELKITTNPENESTETLTGSSPKSIKIEVSIKNAQTQGESVFTWKCDVNLALPENDKNVNNATIEENEKPVEKIRKSLGVESSENSLPDKDESDKLSKLNVQTNIKRFIKYCAKNRTESNITDKEVNGKIIFTLIKQSNNSSFKLPSDFKKLFNYSKADSSSQ